jgi:hypothetical protein
MGDDLGRQLVSSGRITEEQLDAAQKMLNETGGSLPRILVKLGHLKEQDLLEFIAAKEGLAVVAPEKLTADEEIVSKLPRELLEKNDLLPIGHTVSHLTLALNDPRNLPAIEEVRFRTGLEVEMLLACSSDIRRALGRLFGAHTPTSKRGSGRPRYKTEPKMVARQVSTAPPTAGEIAHAIERIDAPTEKLTRALAALLVEKHVASAEEIKDWVHRLE